MNKTMKISVFILISMTVLFTTYIYYRLYEIPKRHIPVKRHNVCPVSFNTHSLRHCNDVSDCQDCDNTICMEVSDKNPYIYKVRNEIINVPNGKWCLPIRAKNTKCNEFTGDPVLTMDNNIFQWRCQCKHPELVRNSGVYGDCNEVVACGNGNLVCPEGVNFCTPGERWKNNQYWNPEAGVCDCPTGERYVTHKGLKLCKKDACFPGVTQDGICRCPSPIKYEHNQWDSTVAHDGKCIPDPCNPDGYFKNGRCMCNKGSVTTQDKLSPVGWTCVSPCKMVTNPCGSRGTCVLNSRGDATCVRCKYPNYQSSDGLCNNIVKHGNVECEHSYECETRACDKTLAPIWKMGDGKKYCSPY